MRAIYAPTGRAREYAALAANLFTGCPNGCLYCYAPGVLRRSREKFHSDVRARPGILEALRRQAPKYAGDRRRVMLCFTCDPFPSCRLAERVTIPALEILQTNSVMANLLTKNPFLATGLLAGAKGLNLQDLRLGVSLSMDVEKSRRRWEPRAESVADRMEAIEVWRRWGGKAWISVEPVIYPLQALHVLRRAGPLVDHVKVGAVSGQGEVFGSFDWTAFYLAARKILITLGASFYLKRDLCLAAGVPADDVHQFGSVQAAARARTEGWCQ